MKVAVYCRVSTEEQADAGTIGNQVDFARGYCHLHGLEIYDFYLDEGVSGTEPLENRPEGFRLMADALRGCFGAVCVYRLDRLARTALEILRTHQRLSEAKVVLKSMTENFDTSTPSGKFFMTTLGGIAEIERETIAERMRLGKDRALREGRWPGGPPPYGYLLANRRLAVCQEQARVVRMIYRLYTEGGMSSGSIADYLNATGVPSPGARAGKGIWHGGRVWSILSNPAYRGVFLFRRRGNKVEIECPAIVSARVWEGARETRRENCADARRNARREYLLKGLIRCGLCGGVYCGDGSSREGRRHYYRCAGSTSGRAGSRRCRSRSVRADIIEDIIWKDVCRFVLASPVELRGITGGVPAAEGQIAAGRREMEEIEAAAAAKETERKRVIGLFRRRIITAEELERELAGIARELEALDRRRKVVGKLVTGQGHYPEMWRKLPQRLESANFREKRDLVRGLVEKITVDVAEGPGGTVSRVTVLYVFGGSPDCALIVETRGKYRLGVPRSTY